jgi:DNA-directed RNA polymerase subunit omega
MIQDITLDELMEKVDSRYTLVVLAAKRARQLTERKNEDNDGAVIRKPVSEALREIASGKVSYRRTKQGIK